MSMGSFFLPMGEIHTSNVHSVLNELQEYLGRPADGADGADNAGQPHLVCSAVHVQVRHKLHLKFVSK